MQMHLQLVHEKYDSSDWALGNVAPSTVPNLLAFGAQPLSHDVNLIALTAPYQFGATAAASAP